MSNFIPEGGGVLRVSSDRDDRMGIKIKTKEKSIPVIYGVPPWEPYLLTYHKWAKSKALFNVHAKEKNIIK